MEHWYCYYMKSKWRYAPNSSNSRRKVSMHIRWLVVWSRSVSPTPQAKYLAQRWSIDGTATYWHSSSTHHTSSNQATKSKAVQNKPTITRDQTLKRSQRRFEQMNPVESTLQAWISNLVPAQDDLCQQPEENDGFLLLPTKQMTADLLCRFLGLRKPTKQPAWTWQVEGIHKCELQLYLPGDLAPMGPSSPASDFNSEPGSPVVRGFPVAWNKFFSHSHLQQNHGKQTRIRKQVIYSEIL